MSTEEIHIAVAAEPQAADAAASDPSGVQTEEGFAAAAARAASLAASMAHPPDGDENNNKRKLEGDVHDEPSQKKSLYVSDPDPSGAPGMEYGQITDTFACPADKVGKVIGKLGATIKDLQQRSGTQIKVDQTVPGEHKPINITGSKEAVARAKQMIQDVIVSDAVPTASVGETTRSVECAPHLVGRIIGRGGETIRSLQTASGAHIQVNQNFPDGVPRQVDISGRADAVDRAQKMVMELMTGEQGNTQTVIQKFGAGVVRVVDCPKPLVGRIIGKGGEIIKGLQKQYNASIQIDQTVNPCKVTITGPAQAVTQAERAVLDVMEGGDGRVGGGPGPGGYNGGGMGGGGGYPGQAPGGGFPPAYPGAFPGYGGAFPGAPAAPFANPYGAYPAAGAYGMPQPNPYAANPYAAQDPYAAYQAQSQAPVNPYGAAPAAPVAASPWQELRDDQSRAYYYNSQTGVSQWEKPAEMP
eukprot:gene9524-12463_t